MNEVTLDALVGFYMRDLLPENKPEYITMGQMAEMAGMSTEELKLWFQFFATDGDYTMREIADSLGRPEKEIHVSSVQQLMEDLWFRHVEWAKVG